MVQNHLQFNQRVSKLGRKHSAMSRGYSTVLRADGLIVVRPKRVYSKFSVKPFIILAVTLIAFKGILLSALGPVTYGERVADLKSGTVVEQAGAWVMQADPLTHLIAEKLGPILR